jgi:hypothetical protein
MKHYLQRILLQYPIIRIIVPPVSGFLFYGAWAMWVNYSHGWDYAITAGLTQGTYSFTITLLLAVVVEWLFIRLANVYLRSLWIFLVAAILLASTSVGVNILTGTPEVLWTVLPGLMVSLTYTVVYIIGLNALTNTKK